VVLRTQESGIPANSSFERHFLYKVTSITFGQGPTPTQLAYTPPGPIVPAPHGNVSSSGSTTSGTASWRLPAPFLSITDLKGPNGEPYLLDGAGEAGDPTLGEPAMEDAVFAPHTGGISAHDPYVYVEERIRADGVPATLRTGQAISMGPCEAWSGAYPDGLNHLAVSRGRIAVLLVSNALSQADLQHYARENLCG
jgi:hypothetical protein